MGSGIEVKVLYGRRRIAYEFFVGEDYREAMIVGGPFCKVELLFDNVKEIYFDGAVTNTFRVILFSPPNVFIQPESNFKAYAGREKQRLYVRCEDPKLSAIFRKSLEHIIEMKTLKAIFVRDKLSALEPRFARTLLSPPPVPISKVCKRQFNISPSYTSLVLVLQTCPQEHGHGLAPHGRKLNLISLSSSQPSQSEGHDRTTAVCRHA